MLKIIFTLLTITILALPNIHIGEAKKASPAAKQFAFADIFKEGGVVHGTVIVENKNKEQFSIVAMADFNLQLVNEDSKKTVAKVSTDIIGRYYFPKVDPGKYKIVWDQQNGWAAGELKQSFELKNSILYADQIKLVAIKGNRVYTGIVTMNNGSAAFFNEYHGIQSMPVVLDISKTISQRTDVNGQFAISTIDREINVALKGSNSRSYSLQDKVHGSYGIKNTLPVLLGFELKNKNGVVVKYPKEREQLNLRALVQDLDGDALTYTWQFTGGIEKKYTGNNLNLVMPKGEGTIVAELLVEDGKGGYISGRHTIGYGQKKEIFSGIVQDKKSKKPVANVDVLVNNIAIKTNEYGHFRVLVPLAIKYNLLISKLGHTTYGQAFEQGQKGRIFFIRRLESTSVNSSNAIVLKDGNAVLSIPKNSLVDSKGKLPKGALTANFSILDIANNEFPGDFIGRDREGTSNLISYGMVEISFYNDAGNKFNLKKGAKATIELPVAGAKEKRILDKAPKTIPIWTYNPKTGEWDRNSYATLDLQKAAYIGTLDHFSTINMDQPGAATCIRVLTDPVLMNKYLRVSDVIGNGIDYATVKEVLIDNALSAIYRLPVSQKVRIEVLDGPGGTPVADVFIDVFDSAQPGLGWVVNANNEVQSGAALADLWPVYPYDVCPLTIHLKHQPNANPANPVVIPYYAFLSYKGIGDAVNAAAYYATIDQGNHRLTLDTWLTHNGYTIAPGLITYGTNADLTRYFNTAFLNNNDLGSGRDMHFLNYPDGTATAYVANYGKFDQNHDNADKAATRNFIAGDVIATVCMEWSPLDNAANQWIDDGGIPFNKEPGPVYSAGYLAKIQASSVTKFFVYTQTALGGVTTRQLSANLDGYQNKFVPNLCNTCHGGSPSAPFTGTHFRELDYRTYKLSGGRLHTAITNAERDAFKGQNDMVKTSGTSISSPAIKELIGIWYDDLDNVQQVAVPDFWKKSSFPFLDFPLVTDHPEKLYTNVVGKSCRTCHVAFDNGTGGGDLGFDHYQEYLDEKSTIAGYTTNITGFEIMPHSVITHRNFWTDTELEVDENGNDILGLPINRAHYLRKYFDSKWGLPIE